MSRVALAAFVLAAPAAMADVVPFWSNPSASTDGLGAYSGTASFDVTGATTGVLTVMLTNVSPPANGGKITGVVFNLASADANAAAVLTGATHPFLNTGAESASPFGVFEAGAALGGSWLGGGSPNAGISVGMTGTFTFSVSATDAAELSAGDFLSDGLVVRFRGFANGGSDKVPAVPAPAAGVMLGLLAAGVAVRRRRTDS